MNNLIKRLVSFAINICLICVLILNIVPTAQAYIMSPDEAISWVESYINQSVDVDGGPDWQPYQCVDLIMLYYEHLGAPRPSGDAKEYATNELPAGWMRMKGVVPQKGDILIYGATSNSEYGHVAIFESNYSHYHQNFNNHPYVEKATCRYDNLTNPYWGVIRPSFNGKTMMTTPMYRMYDPNSSEHFYTGSTEERDILVAEGWNYEGVGFNFPIAGEPVHRLYEPITGEHLYTMSEEEKAALLAAGWNYEGVAFNSATTSEVPQYRMHNPNASRGAYHFTGSEQEKQDLLDAGWEYQGIGWYSCLQ